MQPFSPPQKNQHYYNRINFTSEKIQAKFDPAPFSPPGGEQMLTSINKRMWRWGGEEHYNVFGLVLDFNQCLK